MQANVNIVAKNKSENIFSPYLIRENSNVTSTISRTVMKQAINAKVYSKNSSMIILLI